MQNFIFSIIIPHYNSPDLLMRCLDSIPVREDIQVIVVDDCSPNSDNYIEKYPQLSRPYVEYYKTSQGGSAGRARNTGLNYAKGKWLIFADADDYFYPNAFDIIDNKLDGNDYDIVYFYCDSRDGETNELIEDRVPMIKRGIDTKNWDILRYESYVPWGKIINHDVVCKNKLKFDEVEVCNDIMFATRLGYVSRKIDVIDQALYCCTWTKNSLVSAPSISRIRTRIVVAEKVNDFLSNIGMLKHRVGAIDYVLYFFPRYPISFLWAFWKCRYKDNFLQYTKIVLRRLCMAIIKKIIKCLRWKE